MKILVTGSEGFIGRHLVERLLKLGYTVVGIDNYSRDGKGKKKFSVHNDYHCSEGDVKNTRLLKKLLQDCDHLIALAAKVGGIAYFQTYPYDLASENEKITLSTLDAAIDAHKKGRLKKITLLSSSMVYESTRTYPASESETTNSPPPKSSYGFQKLSLEYLTYAAWQQYKLPYTIIRPCNIIGLGEAPSEKKMGHVIPDLALKILEGQNPLHILGDGTQIRQFIHVKDLVRAIILTLSNRDATNEVFNIASERPVTVLEIAQRIWKRLNPRRRFAYVSDRPVSTDVKKSIIDTTKAKTILGFEAKIALETSIKEIIPWIKKYYEKRV